MQRLHYYLRIRTTISLKTTLLVAFVSMPVLFGTISCHRGGAAPGSVAAAEAQLEKDKKKKMKASKKAKKVAAKRYWKLQSKEAKRSIRRNKRANIRKARHLD
jgi:hypothetical protein